MRFKYDGKHGSNLDQFDNINPQQPGLLCTTVRLCSRTPTGTLSSVARRAYDQNAYTTINFLSKTGFSNSTMFVG